MTYQAANRLATVADEVVEFDADGNMLSGGLNQFDSRNRLVQVGDMVYAYDAENQRIGVNQTQIVVNSQPALSQVLVKEENGQKTFYVYGLDLIGQEVDGEYTSYHFDYRGSTVALTDKDSQIVEQYQYSPYGVLLNKTESDIPFLFNGMYGVMTDSNNLYYMRARFYSPEIKRFINQDILLGDVFKGQSLNRFGYTENNPINRIDPEGKFWWWAAGIGAWIATEIILPSILQSDIPFDSGQLIPSSLPEVVPLVIAVRTITKDVCRSLSETRGSLTNLGSNPNALNIASFESYPKGSFFSGVYDVKTGKWLAYPSGKTQTVDGMIPDNLVRQYTGHKVVNEALTDILGTRSLNRLGFVIEIDVVGYLKIGWNSRSINFFNFRFWGKTVPKRSRQQIIDAIKEVTGKEVYSKK